MEKLLSPACKSILFDLSGNILDELFEGIRKFVTYQVVNEEVLNANLLFYYFSFLEGVVQRSRFEKKDTSNLQSKIREIGRPYEYYLRVLMNKSRRAPIRECSFNRYRIDFGKLRDCLEGYEWEELKVFFLPFRTI